jgi:hypothetical protein
MRVNLSDAPEGNTLENNLPFCKALHSRTPASGSACHGFPNERFA